MYMYNDDLKFNASQSSKRIILLGVYSVLHCTFFVMQLEPCSFIYFDNPAEVHLVCGYPGSQVQVQQGWWCKNITSVF